MENSTPHQQGASGEQGLTPPGAPNPQDEARIALASLDGFLNVLMEENAVRTDAHWRILKIMREQTAHLGGLIQDLTTPPHPRPVPDGEPRNTYKHEGLEVNSGRNRAELHGRPLELTPTERLLLAALTLNAGTVLTYQYLAHTVWNQDMDGDYRRIKTAVKSLRRKLGDDARDATWIFNEARLGYRMHRAEPASQHTESPGS